MALTGHDLESAHRMAGDEKPHPILYTILGLNRAGKVLQVVALAGAVFGGMFYFTILPGLRFSDHDEALFFAARHGDRAGVERALAGGARIDATAPYDRKTALFRAAVFGHDTLVQYLIDHGANPAARAGDGHTALEVVQAARQEEKDPAAARALDAVIAVLERAGKSQ
jgi:hypothetical protein